jgi:PKD repeat protein
LIASNVFGSNQSASTTINVYNTTVTGFAANTTSGLFNLAVSFNVISPNDNATMWNWSFGDGSWQNGSVQNATHVYSTGGLYTVSEIASNPYASNTTTKVNYIDVWNSTTSSFTSNVTSGTIPFGVAFTGTATNGTIYSWMFGDGGFDSVLSPIHTYTVPGNYSVNFSVDNAHYTNWTNKSLYITANQIAAPTTNFTADVTSGLFPLSVVFTDTSTGNPTTWNYSFGDGSYSELQNPSHVYYSGGGYTVSLNTTNAGGYNVKTRSDYITVHNSTVSGFNADITSGNLPLSVTFTATTANDNATYWNWQFGDGWVNGTTQNPTHIYNTAGTYTVIEVAGNPYNETISTRTNYITVHNAIPTVDFTANTTSGYVPLAIQFTDLSTGISITNLDWNWGDGTWTNYTTLVTDPVHVYSSIGLYTVSHYVTNDGGIGSTTKVNYINVTAIPLPVASFTTNVSSGLAPLPVSFTDTSTQSPYAWSWTDGGVEFSTVQHPEYVFPWGDHPIRLTVTSAGGNNMTPDDYWINVTAAPVADFDSNVTFGAPPLAVQFADLSTHAPTSWLWEMKNATSAWSTFAVTQNPEYLFPMVGVYDIRLTATNAEGADIVTKAGYITVSNVTPTPTPTYYSGISSHSASPPSAIPLSDYIPLIGIACAAFLLRKRE